MPIERSGQLTAISFSDFSGGINTALPDTKLAENEAAYIENYEYDYNRLRTRGGLSAPIISINENIKNFFYDMATGGFLITGVSGKVYFADYSGCSEVGTLSGTNAAVYCKFGGEIFIASGGHLQVYDYKTLNTIENSYLCDNVFERFGRLVTTHQGDDYLYYSSVGDAKSEAAWAEDSNDDSSAKFLEVGYKDDGDIITCKPMANDILVFKTNGRIYSVSGEYPNWSVMQVGERSNAEANQKSIEIVGNSVAFITRNGIRSVDTVQTYGNFVMNEIGYKINKLLCEAIHEPSCWNIISKRQLVIAPNSEERRALFVYQYNMGAGYKLTFPAPITDIADTDNGVVMAIGESLHRWGFNEASDNGTPIETKLVTRKVISAQYFFTRKYCVMIDGEDGTVLLESGKQSWEYNLKSPKRIKHLYDKLPYVQLTLKSESLHSITDIMLYTMII